MPFWENENGEMILSEFGQIAFDEWIKLEERFANFELDMFQINKLKPLTFEIAKLFHKELDIPTDILLS